MDEFTKAYFECALWSSTDEDGDPLAEKLSGDGIQDLFQDEMAADGYFGCEACEGKGEVTDEDPDCAVCAGEWQYYVNVDVKVVGSEAK